MTTRLYILATSGLLLAGCAVTDVGNPQDTPSDDRAADVQFVAIEGEETSALTVADDTEVDAARLNVTKIGFRSGAECATPASQFDEQWLVELVKPPTSMRLEGLPGAACGVELTLEPSGDVDFSYEFTFSREGESFTVRETAPVRLFLRGDADFEIGDEASFFFVLYADEWLMGLDIPAIAPIDRPVDDITFQNGFRANFARSFRLVPEARPDGMLDSDELRGVVATTSSVDDVPVDELMNGGL